MDNTMEQARDAAIRRHYLERDATAAVAIAENTANGHLFPATIRPRSETPFDNEAWAYENETRLRDNEARMRDNEDWICSYEGDFL